jgi:hypothetical protein
MATHYTEEFKVNSVYADCLVISFVQFMDTVVSELSFRTCYQYFQVLPTFYCNYLVGSVHFFVIVLIFAGNDSFPPLFVI